jgi:hypothetical protein
MQSYVYDESACLLHKNNVSHYRFQPALKMTFLDNRMASAITGIGEPPPESTSIN